MSVTWSPFRILEQIVAHLNVFDIVVSMLAADYTTSRCPLVETTTVNVAMKYVHKRGSSDWRSPPAGRALWWLVALGRWTCVQLQVPTGRARARCSVRLSSKQCGSRVTEHCCCCCCCLRDSQFVLLASITPTCLQLFVPIQLERRALRLAARGLTNHQSVISVCVCIYIYIYI